MSWKRPPYPWPTIEKEYGLKITVYFCLVIGVIIALFFLWHCDPTLVMASSFLRFLDHTHNDAPQSVGLL